MKSIGLTGGIASGKSTFRDMIAALHAFEVFDADACVHGLLSHDEAVLGDIAARFGSSVRRGDGEIDRAALRELVFVDLRARRDLEEILHPRVRQEWQSLKRTCAEDNRDFLADIPLLFETDAGSSFDHTIVVACSPVIQRERLAARGLPSATAEAMVSSQMGTPDKIFRTDHVIWNDGTLEALQRQAPLVLDQIFRKT